MAAWVRRFRRDPPLPRELRLPCALDPVPDPAADPPLHRQQDLSADALLAEAQRVIASLGAQAAAVVPASGAASVAGTHDPAALPLSEPSQRSTLSAPTLQMRQSAQEISAPMAGLHLCAEAAPHAALAWDSGSGSSPSAATEGEQGSDGCEDDEDLLERWRRRQRAQKARLLQRHACAGDGGPSVS